VHTNVFVGNLSFKTRAAELAAEFTAAGKVVEAKIITRGPRSLGYGFVKMDTEEEANKAVALLSKKSIDGREINVEVAKPRDESRLEGDRDGSAPRGRGGNRGGRGVRGGGRGGNRGRGARGSNDSTNTNSNTNNTNTNTNTNNSAGNSNNAEGQNTHTGGAFRGRVRRFRPRSNSGNGGNHEGDAAPPRRARASRGRPTSEGRPSRDQNRTPSSTTLFVANLPFAINDEGLIEQFKDFKISNAHVVKNRNGRSKGFGFVELENEAAQKAALEAINKKVVDGRELIVKIALTAPENHKGDSSALAPAPAPTEEKEEKKTENASS